jgi:hypothetical protein
MVEAVTPFLEHIKFLQRLPNGAAKQEILSLRKTIADLRAYHFIGTAVECPNLIMDSPGYGLDLVIQRLVGINTYSLNLGFIELGTGTTPPTVNDTGLTTPAVRLAVSYQEDYGATDAIVQAYVSDAGLPNGTYTEIGTFVDGDSTIGTGQIFNHALFLPSYTKVSGQDSTIEVDIGIMNS